MNELTSETAEGKKEEHRAHLARGLNELLRFGSTGNVGFLHLKQESSHWNGTEMKN